jgi:hypothetical protein
LSKLTLSPAHSENLLKTNNVSSAVTNNGHVSEFFSLGRGVRQGDPLSPYLFILVLELLSAAIKNDPEITGVNINDSEYLLSQYADDSSNCTTYITIKGFYPFLKRWSKTIKLQSFFNK